MFNIDESLGTSEVKPSGFDLSIVIPCFNEEQGIERTLVSIQTYLNSEYPSQTYEILVINDGSTDRTEEILRSLKKESNNLRVISFPFNLGRGAALKTGYRFSAGTRVVTLDADLTYDVHHIGRILDTFSDSPKTDIVVVSPYMKGGIVKNVPFLRLLLSRFANWILTGFFSEKISTVTCVVRGYRGDIIRNLPLFEDGKELHLEILRKASLIGCIIKEVPGELVWKKTDGPRRKTSLKVFGAAKNHLFYGLLMKPTRLFKYLALILFFIAIYEFGVIGSELIVRWPLSNDGFWKKLWIGLSQAFSKSPHTFFIAGLSLILSMQTFFSLSILQVLKMQQEESMKHLVSLLSIQKKQQG